MVRPPPRGNVPLRSAFGALALCACSMVGVVQLYRPSRTMGIVPLAHLSAALATNASPAATPTPDAFGRSGAVKVRFALPGQQVEFPIAIEGSSDSLSYQWVSVADSSVAGPAEPLVTARPSAPRQQGFYRLGIVRRGVRQVLDEPMLAVMVPFERKLGRWLNGYLIGDYLAERIGGGHETPRGFIEVDRGMLGVRLSTHITLGDFVTHDDQQNVWPKYVAVDPELLDKLELVLADIARRGQHAEMHIDVHSAFRAPAHNATVPRAARDSRHQYGDAADVQIDTNNDGRIDIMDQIIVMLAVEHVEEAHPDLVGGLGIYTSRRYRTPYLHIDTRGTRSRWTG